MADQKKTKGNLEIAFKASSKFPTEFELRTKEERMAETQKMAYISFFGHSDRMLTDEGRIKIYSHIPGKMYYLDNARKIGHIQIRIDLELTIFLDNIYSVQSLVRSVIFIQGSKVINTEDYISEKSEMENVKFRSYSFSANNFFDLIASFWTLKQAIWSNTIGLKNTQEAKVSESIFVLDGQEFNCTVEDITVKEDDSETVIKFKYAVETALKNAYNKYIMMQPKVK